jgi:hypothetical protein
MKIYREYCWQGLFLFLSNSRNLILIIIIIIITIITRAYAMRTIEQFTISVYTLITRSGYVTCLKISISICLYCLLVILSLIVACLLKVVANLVALMP